MKVKLIGMRAKALERTLTMEGDEVGGLSPDLIITDELLTGDGPPKVGGRYVFPSLVCEALGIPLSEKKTDFLVTSWFDRDWREQLWVGFPIRTLMNEDLGPSCEMGIAGRFIHEGPLVDLLENPELERTLREMSYSGWVSVGVALCEDGSIPITFLQTDLPFYGFFNFLESVKGKMTDFFTGESPRLLESWTMSLLLSHPPYPYPGKSERVFIRGLCPEGMKHFWPLNLKGYKKSLFSDEAVIGVATAWADSLSEVSRRALRTLNSIEVEGKQYRTDLIPNVARRWKKAQELGLIAE